MENFIKKWSYKKRSNEPLGIIFIIPHKMDKERKSYEKENKYFVVGLF